MARYYAEQKAFEKAQSTLAAIKKDALVPAEKANYDYVSGIIALLNHQAAEAKQAFAQVVANEKADKNLKAVAQLQLDDLS